MFLLGEREIKYFRMEYLNKLSTSECPICKGVKAKVLYYINEDMLEAFVQVPKSDFSYPALKKKVAEHIISLWGIDEAKIVECRNCSFIYASPFVAGDATFYNLVTHAISNPSSENENHENWKWEWEQAKFSIRQLTHFSNKELALLEMGASTGSFIKRIAGEIINKENILCLEYAEFGVTQINKLGIEALPKDIRELVHEKDLKEKFDIICLFQVFEHLDNYDKLFEAFNYLTTSGASLILAVPNGDRIRFNELNGGLLDLPPNHLGRFNKNSFNELSKKYNWVIEEFKIQEETFEQIFSCILYYRSLQRKKISEIPRTKFDQIFEYISINLLKLKILLNRKNIGDNIYVHLKRNAS